MERKHLDQAVHIVREIEHLEKILVYLDGYKDFEHFGSSPYSIRFTNELFYYFPANVSYSMFNNILRSSIENDLERLNNRLKEL